MAFPPPSVTIRQRQPNLRQAIRPLQRVLSKGCHSFLSKWLEKTSQSSLAKPFGFDSGVTRITRPLLIPSSACHHIGRRPFVGLEGHDPRDRETYTLISFSDQLFVCFIFLPACFLFLRGKCLRRFQLTHLKFCTKSLISLSFPDVFKT